eukprot:jgi/Orpsp1_1/1179386/evm.model.c7180000069099.1
MKFLIIASLISSIGAFAAAIGDYPLCNGCNVYYTDQDGRWGVENGNWCYIQDSQCPSTTSSAVGVVNNIPVITLVSQSGNSDFATKPVSEHIKSQMMGSNAPDPYYEDCSITIEDVDGTKQVNGVNGKVKVRGNWTSNYVKKSLRINFDEGQSVLGLNDNGKFKNWVLLAEYKDGSMLRNKSALALSRDILSSDGLYASDSKLVELRINDEYFGVYLLAELQQVNEDRVDVTKADENYQGTDIGYFLEMDFGYSSYEDKLQSISINYNDNAPLKPFDGNGGSSTVEPLSAGGNWNFGGQQQQQQNNNNNNNNNTQQQAQNNTNNTNQQQPQQQQNNGWNNWNNNNNNNQQQQQNNDWNNWNNNNNQQQQQQQNNNNNNNQQPQNNAWGNWNFGGNMFKRQFQSSSENMTIKSDIANEQQNAFIANFVNGVYKIMYEAAYNQKALKFNDNYSEVVEASGMTPREAVEAVVDVNSLADLFIISEITCDADLYYSSFYMDVDFGAGGDKKLRFEAPWDFDSGLGNRERCTNGAGHYAANVIQGNTNQGERRINPWLAVLIYEDWFQSIIKTKWSKAFDSGVFGRVVDMIHSDATNYADAFNRNYEKWNNIVDNSKFANELSNGAKQAKNEKEAAEYLASWLENRVEFINSNWHN